MDSSIDVSLIIFAFLAGFVIWKLWSLLGKRPNDVDTAAPPSFPRPEWQTPQKWGVSSEPPETAVVQNTSILLTVSWADYIESQTVTEEMLRPLVQEDPNFDPKIFLEEAMLAYEKIIQFYSTGNLEGLSSLLSTQVYDEFAGAIKARQSRGEQEEALLVALDKPRITDVSHPENEVAISVKFNAQLIRVMKDVNGAVIAGDAKTPYKHIDVWTFSRVLLEGKLFGSGAPMWRLSATRSL